MIGIGTVGLIDGAGFTAAFGCSRALRIESAFTFTSIFIRRSRSNRARASDSSVDALIIESIFWFISWRDRGGTSLLHEARHEPITAAASNIFLMIGAQSYHNPLQIAYPVISDSKILTFSAAKICGGSAIFYQRKTFNTNKLSEI